MQLLQARRYVTQIDAQQSRRYVTDMVLTNAERQARYRERLRAAAVQGTALTEAMAELIASHRRTIAALRRQIELMELGLQGRGGFTTCAQGTDTTAATIARTRAQIKDLQALVDKHDPAGATALHEGDH